ncbi:MAG: 50S ribosomal protein L5 [Patescibacteria group bacterium]
MTTIQETYKKKTIPALQEAFRLKNVMQVPKIKFVSVNVGVGRIKDDAQLKEIQRILSLVTGQRSSSRRTKRAIASFKTRIGMVVGYSVTLRGKRMYDFLNRLVHVVLPRMRDFHGISRRSFDGRGNLTIGIKEHIVFPELIGEDVKFIFGMEVTVVGNAKSREQGMALFESIGFPLAKEEETNNRKR